MTTGDRQEARPDAAEGPAGGGAPGAHPATDREPAPEAHRPGVALDDDADLEAGRRSLKAFALALTGLGAAWAGVMVVGGDAAVLWLLPYALGATGILLGLRVWRMDVRPKATWRGWATGAILLGTFTILRHAGIAAFVG